LVADASAGRLDFHSAGCSVALDDSDTVVVVLSQQQPGGPVVVVAWPWPPRGGCL
jgi:hypothetical protein